ncbi:MAG: bifunctional diaminohydroxyphosphoribosylaminopyrimidine deaminase/5-amino-6-(5-phosphoribosylamino)uracil reductase RibD [Planctomycetes bacterium]|nr:bifunctional diaminohydroxyphosphoribosylaminopyrimidine deaminase/5-amino-6-(5-phosphoribosylamino)uracil reductase RibD [Planctomycetota bacterium]
MTAFAGLDRAWSPRDDALLLRAARLARRGRGAVEPNPMVGALLVRRDRVVAESFHARFGGPHAEIVALRRAGRAARGATLYVTLEPCDHYGKTPPCVDAILAAGVARVVAGVADPLPEHAGGLRRLAAAGVGVTWASADAPARRACEALIVPFRRLYLTGMPTVTAKWAMTLDGRIATNRGKSRWITGEPARRAAHRLRALAGAVVVGIGTVLADDPMLTARFGPRYALAGRQPLRVVLDSGLRLPLRSALARTARSAPVLVFHAPGASATRRRALERLGVQVEAVPKDRGHGLAWREVLRALGRRMVTHVLVEGGARVLGGAFDAGVVDRAAVFVAPGLIFGGAHAVGPVGGVGVPHPDAAWRLAEPTVRRVGGDLLIEGDVVRAR